MFENLLPSPGHARRRRVRNALIGVSVAAHGALAVGLIVLGMWKIEKLQTERSTVSVAVLPPPGDSGGGGRPKLELTPKEVIKPVKHVVEDLTQPDPAPIDDKPVREVAVEDRSGGAGGADGDAPGNGTGGDGRGLGVPTVGQGCLAPPCGTATAEIPPPVVVVVPEQDDPVKIPPTAAKRISGDDQITAPESVRAEMLHLNKATLRAAIDLCIDARGTVERAKVRASTSYDAYDAKLLREMRTWKYQPYTVDGQAKAACFTIVVVYKLKR